MQQLPNSHPERAIPKAERNLFITRIDALRTDDPPLDVTPAADDNVMRITEDCLFMRTASSSLYGGRSSLSWWTVMGSIFVFIFLFCIHYGYFIKATKYNIFIGNFFEYCLENWESWVVLIPALPVGFSWTFVHWRRELPIIFNRKTQKVTCMVRGHIVSQDWAHLQAYIKDITTVQSGGVPANEGVLTLSFPWRNPKKGGKEEVLGTVIHGTTAEFEAMMNRGIYGAAMVWEYIRLYMREGAQALPPFGPRVSKYRITSIRESWEEFNLIKVFIEAFDVKFYWLPVSVPFHLFFVFPFCLIAIPSDLIYMGLDRILPRRKWPQEFLDACDHVWDGSYD